MTIKEFEIQLALGSLTNDIKWELANNINTPKEVLTILSTDESWYTRCNVAENSNTPVEVLIKLSTDKNNIVRYYAANNLNTPKEVLTKL